MSIARRRLHTHARFMRSSQTGTPIHGEGQWTAFAIRAKGKEILVIGAYYKVSAGMDQDNRELTEQIVGLIRDTGLPYIWYADWNMTLEEHRAYANWQTHIAGTFVQPQGLDFTCRQGTRVIDYCLVADELCSHFTLTAAEDSPWDPHLAIQGTLNIQVLDKVVWRQRKPPSLPMCLGPPSRPWEHFTSQANQELGEGQVTCQYPYCEDYTDEDLSKQFSILSRALELHLQDVAPEESHTKRPERGQPAHFHHRPMVNPRPPASEVRRGARFWATVAQNLAPFLTSVAGGLGSTIRLWWK